MTETTHALDIAVKAVRLYAETHPRPIHVTMKQAGQMLGVTRQTVAKYVRAGLLRLDGTGMIPTLEVDKLLEVR